METATKRCAGCKTDLPLEGFWRMTKSKDGRQKQCKTCFYKARRERENRHVWSGGLRQREAHYRRNFGISVADVESMMKAQGGVCAICEAKPAKRFLHVDHDHTTGVVRGLLCFKCNVALGYLADNPARLRVAAAYLERGGNRGR